MLLHAYPSGVCRAQCRVLMAVLADVKQRNNLHAPACMPCLWEQRSAPRMTQ